MTFSFEALLSAYDAFQQQKTIEVTEQLKQLQQQLSAQLVAIRQEEAKFITAQQNCLDLMRPYLAGDARTLLKTPQLATFVESLLGQLEANAICPAAVLQIAPSPEFWLLNSIPIPLRLYEIEQVQCDTPDGKNEAGAGMRMQIEISGWQQLVFVSAHSLQQEFGVAAAIEQILSQLPSVDSSEGENDAYLKQVAIQELACVVLYVGSVFNIESRTAQLDEFEGWLEDVFA
ncbi:hypothetical protein IFO70_35115 [Phormidium tenue FACHB-886]|nr:hypothetical protein [Phormidium tenue FACHB-886]